MKDQDDLNWLFFHDSKRFGSTAMPCHAPAQRGDLHGTQSSANRRRMRRHFASEIRQWWICRFAIDNQRVNHRLPHL